MESLSISHGSLVEWSPNDQIRAHSTRSVVTTATRLQFVLLFRFTEHPGGVHYCESPSMVPWQRIKKKQSKLEIAALLNLFLVQNVRSPMLSCIHLSCRNLLSREVSIIIAAVFVQYLKYLWIWKLKNYRFSANTFHSCMFMVGKFITGNLLLTNSSFWTIVCISPTLHVAQSLLLSLPRLRWLQWWYSLWGRREEGWMELYAISHQQPLWLIK